MTLPTRNEIKTGMRVQIVEKQNQRSGQTTEGVVKRILTSSETHPHGIKVELESGEVPQCRWARGAGCRPAGPRPLAGRLRVAAGGLLAR